MTDSPSPADPGPVDPDVELASAHLDDEAGADERARVEDPVVAAHLAAFGRVADQVRDVPPPPAGLLDDQVARAMASFDDEARVVPIGRTAGATPWWQRIPLGAVAAALIVVALVGIASLGGFGGDDEDTAATAFDSTDDSAGDSGDDSAAGGAQAPMADAMEESATLETEAGLAPDRARFDSYDDLVASLQDELARPTAATGGQAGDPDDTAGEERSAGDGEGVTDPCDAVAVLDVDPATVVLVRAAVVASDDVTVVVHDADDGRRLAAVDDATCTVVLDRLL
jgi:hypothetical protein